MDLKQISKIASQEWIFRKNILKWPKAISFLKSYAFKIFYQIKYQSSRTHSHLQIFRISISSLELTREWKAYIPTRSMNPGTLEAKHGRRLWKNKEKKKITKRNSFKWKQKKSDCDWIRSCLGIQWVLTSWKLQSISL